MKNWNIRLTMIDIRLIMIITILHAKISRDRAPVPSSPLRRTYATSLGAWRSVASLQLGLFRRLLASQQSAAARTGTIGTARARLCRLLASSDLHHWNGHAMAVPMVPVRPLLLGGRTLGASASKCPPLLLLGVPSILSLPATPAPRPPNRDKSGPACPENQHDTAVLNSHVVTPNSNSAAACPAAA
jgi:hypothetical protein